MIGSGILLALTLAITVGWLYVELSEFGGSAGGGTTGRDDETELDV